MVGTVAVIGAGVIGGAIVKCLQECEEVGKVIATRRNLESLKELKETGAEVTTDNNWTMFRCGTLIVQTAGASANLELFYVRRPEDVQHLITEAVAAYQQESGGRTERVSSLLNATASLNDAEARAFLVALQAALKEKPPVDTVTDEEVEGLMEKDDE